MRFDDSLDTVLSAEMTSSLGAQSTWRQLVDLVGRGRAADPDAAIARLRQIRYEVPQLVRAASARALTQARPPAALVRLFAEDEPPVARPVLRSAELDDAEWIALLPRLTPSTRSILRHRRDLTSAVRRALESFGRVDFVLGGPPDSSAPSASAPIPAPTTETIVASSFVSIAAVAAGLPVVAEALRRAGEPDAPPATPEPASQPEPGAFRIAELVARIDAYQRRREADNDAAPQPEIQSEMFAHAAVPAQRFSFETDSSGVVRWLEGAARAPLIGLSLDLTAQQGSARIDGVAAGAFRRRAGFSAARLVVDGTSDAAGAWRMTGVPAFDRASGRFIGYRGTARRPRADESAEPRRAQDPAADALRQLVHELRTPTNAIAGFAEMIEAQMLGPVPPVYRAQAATIRAQTLDLLGAIEDIDMAARIETQALDLRPRAVAVAPLLETIADDLAPLAALRGATLQHRTLDDGLAIMGDDRAVERLVARLMATLLGAAMRGEEIGIVATREEWAVSLAFDRPVALADYGMDALLTIDTEAEREGGPLLGTGFALRLARNLATELRGSLTIDARRLTLRLPAVEAATMEQASSN